MFSFHTIKLQIAHDTFFLSIWSTTTSAWKNMLGFTIILTFQMTHVFGVLVLSKKSTWQAFLFNIQLFMVSCLFQMSDPFRGLPGGIPRDTPCRCWYSSLYLFWISAVIDSLYQ